jgi:deazaflavin-dependent oxidoreductase (nitroreductase family)
MARTLPAAAYRLIGAVGTSRIITRLHPVAYRWFGSAGPIGRSFGIRSVVLTTTGSRSGVAREVPLYALEDGDGFVVIGSNGGRERPPAWVGNLRAQPEATVRVGRHRVIPVRAREAEGDERDRLWAEAVASFPGYARYQERVSRRIPVIVLEPAGPLP